MEADANVTTLLHAWSQGDQDAFEQLAPIVYAELRRLASHYLKRERADHTLQSTALVHEAYLRLVGQNEPVRWQNRAHFFGIAARLIRQILVDHARRRKAAKRDGGVKLPMEEAWGWGTSDPQLDLVELHEALEELAALDERQAWLVELRFFGGLSEAEAAEVAGVTERTVRREWATARAWLYARLKG